MVAPGGHTLTAQVGGHAGVLTSEDESLVIKPALPREIEFYQTAATHPAFEALRPFLPAFMGTLKVQGESEGRDEEGNTLIAPVSVPASEGGGKEGEQDKSLLRVLKHAITPDPDPDDTILQHLVLENLTHPFKKPNVIDVKIGTVLWDEGASADKRERMEKAARDTTTFETGIRLTGFQVYDTKTGLAVQTPKAYGKSLTVSQLYEGISKCFPTPSLDDNGLSAPVLHSILVRLVSDLRQIREAVNSVEMRMVGGSVLIVYEGDEESAVKSLEKMKELESKDQDEEDEDEEEDTAKEKIGPAYVAKLIDFAHTRLVSGQGPDEGVVRGLDTLIRLVDERIAAVSKA